MLRRKPTPRTAFAAFALALAALAAPLMMSSSAEAGRRWFEPRPEPDVVVAVSRHGNGRVSGPVRWTSTGYEVRKPTGTWIACRRSCAETLRVETIDLLENNDGSPTGYGTALNECGIFGCLDFGIGIGR